MNISVGETGTLESGSTGVFAINTANIDGTLVVNADTTIDELNVDSASAGNYTATIGGTHTTVISSVGKLDAGDKLVTTGSGDFTLTTTSDLAGDITVNSTGANTIELTGHKHTGTILLNEDTTIYSSSGDSDHYSVQLASGKTLTTSGVSNTSIDITLDTISGGNLIFAGYGDATVRTKDGQDLNLISVKSGTTGEFVDNSTSGQVIINQIDLVEGDSQINLYGLGVTETRVNEVNIGGNSTSPSYLLAHNNLHLGTVNLFDNDTAIQAAISINTDGVLIDTVNILEGKYGAVGRGDAGWGTITQTNINGTLACYNNWTMEATESINVGKTGTLDLTTGSCTLTTTSGSKINIDLGDETDTSVYAKVLGQIVTSDATNSVSKVSDVYGVKGVSGQTYTNVFDTAIQAADGSTFGDGKVLSTEDKYRIYTLTNNGLSISVTSNNNTVHNTVVDNGGSSEAAKAADYMIDHQGEFDQSGQDYVDKMSNLSGADFARAANETIGVDATAPLYQVDVHTITAASRSVTEQMVSFRSGNLSYAMASSLGSAGSTAALDDMADADELADAYEAGFDSESDQTVYRKVEVWANTFGGFGEQGTVDTMNGYSYWNAGAMIGFDYALSKELRLGGLFGYSYNKTNRYYGQGEDVDNTLRLGAYSSFCWDNFFVDFSPSMGIHIIKSTRNLIVGNQKTTGERTGFDFNINGAIGYSFNFSNDIQLTPSFSLGYTMFHDPEYTETGAGAANLSYGSFTSNSLLQDIGIKLGKLIDYSNKLSLLPEVWGGWELEYLNTGGYRNSTTSSSIGGQSYSTTMNGMSTHRAYWGAGLTALVNDNISVYGRYDHKLWSSGYFVGFSAGVKIKF